MNSGAIESLSTIEGIREMMGVGKDPEDVLTPVLEKIAQELPMQSAKQAPKVVNSDEVVRETMHIPLFCYRDEPLLMNDGTPFLDREGNQRIGRVVAGTRTAKIKNIAPIDVYTQAMSLFSGLGSGSLNDLTKEQLDGMTDLILECWKISEPFMTKEELREGIDGIRLMEVFTRFFFQESQTQSISPSPGGSTTQKG